MNIQSRSSGITVRRILKRTLFLRLISNTAVRIWREWHFFSELMNCVIPWYDGGPTPPSKTHNLYCPSFIVRTDRLEKVWGIFFGISFPWRTGNFISALFVPIWVPAQLFILQRRLTYMLHWKDKFMLAGEIQPKLKSERNFSKY